jgi:L-aminopeptidase/D-esterase-like protein
VVGETWDGGLNDINGFHVRPEHVHAAIATAAGGPVAEGNVGGGTGMICHGFKGGIGTASRLVERWTVGVLVQANHGARERLRIEGVPVGELIPDEVVPVAAHESPGAGSIIAIVATDAPLLPHQLKRVATRVALGVGRMGGFGGNGSGDIFLAFSTANPKAAGSGDVARVEILPNARMNPLFQATVEATEEAILNALLAAETMTGANGVRVHALPHDRLLEAMRKYGRLR